MTQSFVHTSRDKAHPNVLLVTIDNPPANAMTLLTYRELIELFSGLENDPTIRCVVLTGAGDKYFVAGSDVRELGELTPATTLDRTRLGRKVFDLIRSAPVPVIAAVKGYALGSGLVIASVCDIIIASDTAKFSLPEINVGVMGGTRHLARIVPEKVIRWMALTGRKVDAAYMQRLGAVQEVVSVDKVLETAFEVADDMVLKSPAGLRLMKEVINLTEAMPLNDGYHVETYATAIISAHPDSKEAALAFREKRKPEYQV